MIRTARKRSRSRAPLQQDQPRDELRGRDFVRFVREQQHRVAILDALSAQAVALFTTATGDRTPRMLIETPHGHVEPADENVVVEIAHELAHRAERERERLEKVLSRRLDEITRADCPPPPGADHGGTEAFTESPNAEGVATT